jgi:two-component system, NtrC family, response regulator AtoC
MHNILVVDDEPSILMGLKFALEDEFIVQCNSKVTEALEILNQNSIDIVLLDKCLGEYDGIEVLQEIKKQHPGVIVIIMTAYGSIESTIEAIHKGAYYYITKPLDLQGLKILINKALEYKSLTNHIDKLTKQLEQKKEIPTIIGNSKPMDEIFSMIEKIKNIDINVLITGESGTGKEMIAKFIHYSSKRNQSSFEAINCAAIPHNLLESELFGYEKGAFTGANQRYKGKFELAHGGTLFLDEIGDMELTLQTKLLRAIQERKIVPLGSEKPVPVDFRLISATNKNLSEEVKRGNFREDLYFRLNVISVETPPLRKRREDIPLLVKYFIEKYSRQFNRDMSGITPSAAAVLEKYDYPGNIRELENIIERAVALASKDIIHVHDLPKEVIGELNLNVQKEWIPVYIGESLEEVEKKLIMATLEQFEGNRTKASKVLGISDRHLRTKVKEYQQKEIK